MESIPLYLLLVDNNSKYDKCPTFDKN
jgi:hypothetical protein